MKCLHVAILISWSVYISKMQRVPCCVTAEKNLKCSLCIWFHFTFTGVFIAAFTVLKLISVIILIPSVHDFLSSKLVINIQGIDFIVFLSDHSHYSFSDILTAFSQSYISSVPAKVSLPYQILHGRHFFTVYVLFPFLPLILFIFGIWLVAEIPNAYMAKDFDQVSETFIPRFEGKISSK